MGQFLADQSQLLFGHFKHSRVNVVPIARLAMLEKEAALV